MRHRIIQQVCQIAGINIGETEQTPRKIRRIVIGTEYTAKLLIEYPFCTLSKIGKYCEQIFELAFDANNLSIN